MTSDPERSPPPTDPTGSPPAPVAGWLVDRRGALLRLAGVAVAGGLFTRFLTPDRPRAGGQLRVASADVPRDGALVFERQRVAIVDRAGVRYALDLRCTHLGCTADVGADAIRCHCHGSVFDLAGGVVHGPASRALEALPIREDGDVLEVLL
ncbi:MAG: cytochrome B6 [Deltaproteobacteria bacterium HGW-Deltaproteobacteria-14]|jgi:Rieske Fe-S protein|nr:MAG: cytochrome B6 [Deltaproteobacteria bacterium HGW-Deltaproteobacteria-14]